MAEYIEREAFLEMLKRECSPKVFAYLADQVNAIPAADVRPVVRGRWEKGTGENGVTTSLFCSVCHYENRHWHEWNYCPNCGADMREES